MMKISCPCCGQPFNDQQLAELKGELAEYGPPDQPVMAAPMVAAKEEKAEPKSMLDAMNAELDDPKKKEARAARKE
jgi:hypothetical protein